MWYDDEGRPVTRNGVHLTRPCPPACHRCDKARLKVEPLTEGNMRLYSLHTDATLGLLTPGELSSGEREALRLIERTLRRTERMRLAADLAEMTYGGA